MSNDVVRVVSSPHPAQTGTYSRYSVFVAVNWVSSLPCSSWTCNLPQHCRETTEQTFSGILNGKLERTTTVPYLMALPSNKDSSSTSFSKEPVLACFTTSLYSEITGLSLWIGCEQESGFRTLSYQDGGTTKVRTQVLNLNLHGWSSKIQSPRQGARDASKKPSALVLLCSGPRRPVARGQIRGRQLPLPWALDWNNCFSSPPRY